MFYGNDAPPSLFPLPSSLSLQAVLPSTLLTDYVHLYPIQALDPVDSSLVGVVICKLETHAANGPPTRRGYIAMLAVSAAHRGHGVATSLVRRGIDAMAEQDADEVVLETEESNSPAIRLYERLGFFRSKKLHRYYLNGNSAYRLVLPLKPIDTDSALDLALGDEDR